MINPESFYGNHPSEEDIDESVKSEEYKHPLDSPDSFDIEEREEEGIVYSGNNDNLIKSDGPILDDEYDQTYDSEPEVEPASLVDDDDKKEYVAKDTGQRYSFNELVKMAEGRGLSVQKNCEIRGIVPIDSSTDEKPKTNESVIDQIEAIDPKLAMTAARLLKDAIEVASCMAGPSGMESMMHDLERLVLKSIRLGSTHDNPKPNEQELAMMNEFKDKFCGSQNAVNRNNYRKELEDYLKRK